MSKQRHDIGYQKRLKAEAEAERRRELGISYRRPRRQRDDADPDGLDRPIIYTPARLRGLDQ